MLCKKLTHMYSVTNKYDIIKAVHYSHVDSHKIEPTREIVRQRICAHNANVFKFRSHISYLARNAQNWIYG